MKKKIEKFTLVEIQSYKSFFSTFCIKKTSNHKNSNMQINKLEELNGFYKPISKIFNH
jgi:hypothetical protein